MANALPELTADETLEFTAVGTFKVQGEPVLVSVRVKDGKIISQIYSRKLDKNNTLIKEALTHVR